MRRAPAPERGLLSADRLAALSPAAGHLVHIPAHSYMRTGDYERAAAGNEWAAKADQAYIYEVGRHAPDRRRPVAPGARASLPAKAC